MIFARGRRLVMLRNETGIVSLPRFLFVVSSFVYFLLQFVAPYKFTILPFSPAALASLISIFLMFAVYRTRAIASFWVPVAPFMFAILLNFAAMETFNPSLVSALLCSIVFGQVIFVCGELNLSWPLLRDKIDIFFKAVLFLNLALVGLQLVFGEEFFVASIFATTGGEYRIPVGLYDVHTTFAFLTGFMLLFCLANSASNERIDYFLLFLCFLTPFALFLGASRGAVLAFCICVSAWALVCIFHVRRPLLYFMALFVGVFAAVALLSHPQVNFPSAAIFKYKFFYPILDIFQWLSGSILNLSWGGRSEPAILESIQADGSALERLQILEDYFGYFNRINLETMFGAGSRFLDDARRLPTVPHNSFLELLYEGGFLLFVGFVVTLSYFSQKRFWSTTFFVPTIF